MTEPIQLVEKCTQNGFPDQRSKLLHTYLEIVGDQLVKESRSNKHQIQRSTPLLEKRSDHGSEAILRGS